MIAPVWYRRWMCSPVIRTHSPRMTIGGGLLVDTALPRKRKMKESEPSAFWLRRQGLGDPQASEKGIGRGDLLYASQLKAQQFELCLEQALVSGR